MWEDGTIDFGKRAAYVLHWNSEGEASGVRHIGGATANFPDGVKVANEYNMADERDEMNSQLVLGAQATQVAALFKPGEGPYKNVIPKCRKEQLDYFKDLAHRLCEMPSSEHPASVVPDPKYLAGSDDVYV